VREDLREDVVHPPPLEAAAVARDVAEPEAEERVVDAVARTTFWTAGSERVDGSDVAEVLEPFELAREVAGRDVRPLGERVVSRRSRRDRTQDREVGAGVADPLAFAQQMARLV